MEPRKRYRFTFLCTIIAFALYCEHCYAGDCPADGRTWVPFAQSCYHFVHGEEDLAKSYTYESARAMCRGYELLSIRSPEENKFIVQYSPQVWKGNIDVWLDMYFNADNETLLWHDDTQLDFANWQDDSMPADTASMDICAAMHSSTGKWMQVSCAEDTENGVVCKTSQKPDKKESGSNSPLLSALVILSVLVILGLSAVVWFLHQRHGSGGSMFTSFEYHPPFRSPLTDEAALVGAEETEELP
ncbi:CD302 antigen [Megalops cyprinoides]|uniref:CD302 antigen n=1 Tax=Megalops cyprinoides TaxID=118141 RepID=UPI00186549CB|nr:CD302 antigen [Megalops cyprinoides]